MDVQHIKNLLLTELGWLPEGDGMERLLAKGELLTLPSRHSVMELGGTDPDVYVIVEGILRSWDINGGKERTFGFALPGTMLMSKWPFVHDRPSIYAMETCCPAKLLRISRQDFWEVVGSDINLALWALGHAYEELFYQECKFSIINSGSARDRLEAMMKERPEILKLVPQRYIASYLGISPEYFCTLKRDILKQKH